MSTQSPSLFEAFGIESPIRDTRQIPLAALTPMGTHTNVEINEGFVFEFNTVKRSLLNVNKQKPVWCWGPSGCGKTEFYRQLAARLNRPCHIISFGEETSIRELLGTFSLVPATDAGMGMRTQFELGQLIQAITDPMAIVVLDEFPMAPVGVTAQLNRLLECGEITVPETGKTYKMAEGVVINATANTPGSMDESGVYAGNQVQNGATRSRFSGLKMKYLSPENEELLLQKACPAINAIEMPDANKTGARMMVDIGNACRSLVDSGRVTLPFTVRNLKEWANSTLALKDISMGFADAYYDLLSPSEAIPVNEVFHKHIGKRLEN